MRLSYTRGLSALILPFVYTLSLSAASAAPRQPFEQGIDAFQQGDYRSALQYFQQARDAGNRSQQLLYNTAVTHYKLGNLTQAAEAFEQLAAVDDWRGIANYNLGVIAEKRGAEKQALRHYRAVLAHSTDAKLTTLATNRIDRLSPPTEQRAQKRHFGLLSLSLGRDDNVIALPDELQQSSSGGEDDFYELLGYFQFYPVGSRGDGLQINALAYRKDYSDFDSFDVSAYQLGVTRETQLDSWQLDYGLAVDRTDVDGEELTTDLRLELAAHTVRGNGRFSLYYRPRFSDAGSDYPQLDGEEHRFGVKWHQYGNGWDWRVGYRLEIHDRDDLETATTFFSYSPTRHRLESELSVDTTRRLTSVVGALYEFSEYDDENRHFDSDGVFKVAERERSKWSAWLQAQYAFTSAWQGIAEVRYTDYDDEFELYTYDQLEFSLTAEYTF